MTMGSAAARDIAHLTDLVTAARAILADGRVVDLAGLDEEARRVAERLKLDRPDNPGPIKTALLALVDEMDRLKAAIEDQRASFAKELTALQAGRGAAHAYGRPR